MSDPKPRAASGLRLVAAACALLAASGLAASCANDTRDSHCDPGATDDRCISNPDGLGPKVSEPRCGLPTADEQIADHCPGFDEILLFMTDKKRGNCTADGCHGYEATASVGIFFPRDPTGTSLDACGTYKKLTTTSGSVGLPYVVADDPTTADVKESIQSWMYCNVTGTPGGGFPMPKPGGVPVQSDATLIRDWIICGAPGPAGCTPAGGT